VQLFASLPDRVTLVEVSPRDGLQNEPGTVATADKLRLVEALLAAGLTRLELTSFVSKSRIPQLADAEELVRALGPREGVRAWALVPNAQGYGRARAAGLTEMAVFVSASETHNRKNVGATIADTLARIREVASLARADDVRLRGYVSCVWGCPYEGEIAVGGAVALARTLVDAGCEQVSLGDTIGVGTPVQTARIVDAFARELPLDTLALHLHDTRGTALANALTGLELGVRTFDTSVGGLGGCPFAPGAAGNLATEDLVYMLDGMGVRTGVDLAALCEAGRVAQEVVGRRLPGKVLNAGPPVRRPS